MPLTYINIFDLYQFTLTTLIEQPFTCVCWSGMTADCIRQRTIYISDLLQNLFGATLYWFLAVAPIVAVKAIISKAIKVVGKNKRQQREREKTLFELGCTHTKTINVATS